jgi:hypothetical protein
MTSPYSAEVTSVVEIPTTVTIMDNTVTQVDVVEIGIVGPQGAQGIQGDQGPQGPQGPSGAGGGTVTSVTASAPLTGGTITTSGSIGLDQTALSLTASQVSGVAKLASSNTFTGNQQAITPTAGSATSAISVNASPTTHVAIINRNGGNPSNGNALLVTAGDYGTDANPMDTTLGISGYELGKGTIKATHFKPTSGTSDSDANASVLSLRCNGTGTAAQGIFFDAEDGGTTGKILNLRNNGTEMLVLNSAGQLQLPTVSATGGITIGGDTELFRAASKVLRSNSALYLNNTTSDSVTFYTSVTSGVGSSVAPFAIKNTGKCEWGVSGSARDTFLYRSGVNALTTDGSLTATSFSGALTGNASTATVLATARTINGTSFDGSANITIDIDGGSA